MKNQEDEDSGVEDMVDAMHSTLYTSASIVRVIAEWTTDEEVGAES